MLQSKALLLRAVVLSTAIAGVAGHALAADGTWNVAAGGDWAEPSNWLNAIPADGAGSTANFNAVDIVGDVNVGSSVDQTISNLSFGDLDPATGGNWILNGNLLTLAGTPVITVGTLGTGNFAQINRALGGTAGFTKAGAGELRLNATHTFTGNINVNAGTLNFIGGGYGSGTVNINLANGTTLATSIGLGSATGSVVLAPGATATVIQSAGGTISLNGLKGSANSTLNLQSTTAALTRLDRDWAGHAAVNMKGIGTDGITGNSTFQMRVNGGGFNANAFQNTAVHLDGATLSTNTNSGGNTLLIGALSGTASARLFGGNAGPAVYQVGGLNTSTEFAGHIDGPMSLLKVGTGTLTLSTNSPSQFAVPFDGVNPAIPASGITFQPRFDDANVNRRAGFVVISGGSLKLKNQAIIPGGILNTTTGVAVDSIIDIKAGTSLDVSETTNPYTTSIRQRLIGTGTVIGNYTHDEGVIAPGNVSNTTSTATRENIAAGTLTFAGNLNFSGAGTGTGGVIEFNLSPSLTTGNDKIVVAGGNLSGPVTLNVSVTGTPAVGSYVLIDSPSAPLTGDAPGTWQLQWPGRGTPPSLVQTANQLLLNVGVTPIGLVHWSGATNNVWDTNGTANWYNPASGATNPDKYFGGDTVRFLDTYDGVTGPSTTSVALNSVVQPGSVEVNTAGEYTIAGTGRITGGGTLLKRGAGTLNLTTVNDYSGATTIEGGTLNLGTTGTLGGGGVTMHTGTVLAYGANKTFTTPFTFQPNAAVTFRSNAGATTAGVDINAQLFLNGVLSGSNVALTFEHVNAANHSLDISGDTSGLSGSITFASQFAPRLTGTAAHNLANVAVDLGNNNTSLSVVNNNTPSNPRLGALSGGELSTLSGHGSSAGGTNANVTWEIGSLNTSTTFAGAITNGNIGGATVPNTTAIVKVGTGTLTLTGPSRHTGGVTVTAGRIVVGRGYDASTTPASGGSLGNGPLAVSGTGTVQLVPDLAAAVMVSAVTTTAAGQLDLKNNDMIIDYTGTSPLASVQAQLLAGGIMSSSLSAGGKQLVIGYADTAAFTPTPAVPYGPTLDTSMIVLSATIGGDTDLTGNVNFDDLLALAQNYDANGTGKVWHQGDSNYDGKVNFDDLLILAQNYGTAALAGDQAALVGADFAADFALAQSLVPEPATLGLLAGGLSLLSRRRASR